MLKRYPDLREWLRSMASDIFHRYSLPRWMLFLHDTTAVFTAFIFAYLLRYNLIAVNFPYDQAIIHGLIALLVYAVFIVIFRSYAGLIRHTTLTDVSLVFVSTSSATIFLMVLSMAEIFWALIKALLFHCR